MSAQVIVMILGLVFVIYIARYLGAEGFGKYSFAVAFTGLFSVVCYFGLNMLVIRAVSRDKSLAGKYLGSIILLRVLLSLVTLFLIFTVINLMGYPEDTKIIVYIMGLYVVLTAYALLPRSIFQAFEKMEYTALMQVIEKIILVSLGIYVLISGYKLFESELIAVVSIFLISALFNLVISFYICIKNFTKPEFEFDKKFWRHLLKEGFPLALYVILVPFFFKITIISVSLIEEDVATGMYSAAFNLLIALLVIPQMFNKAMLPVMSKLFVSGKKSLKFSMEKSIKYLFILAFPIAVGIIILGDKIILLFYGKEFTDSILVIQILALFLPFRFINFILINSLISINKQWFVTISILVCGVSNVISNLILIPVYGVKGAAIATVITEILFLILLFYFVNKFLYKEFKKDITGYLSSLLKVILGGIIMGVFVYYFKDLELLNIQIIDLIITVIFAGLLYFVVLFVLRTFSKQDLNMLKSIKERK